MNDTDWQVGFVIKVIFYQVPESYIENLMAEQSNNENLSSLIYLIALFRIYDAYSWFMRVEGT